jgi:hypothetical protein
MDTQGDLGQCAELRRIAYHEAGHVVADWETDFPPTKTTVEPGEGVDPYTDSAPEDCRVVEGDPERTRKNMWDFLVSVIAGEIAEALATGQPVVRTDAEYEDARGLATRRGLSLPDAECQACDLLRRRWACVEMVADALFRERTLNEARLHEIRTKCLHAAR